MKQVFLLTILISAFCFSAFAQTNENLCPRINIKAPEHVQPDNVFKVFASFEKESQPLTSKFDWVIIEEGKTVNKVSQIKGKGFIEIGSKNLRDGGTITVLAEALNKKCEELAMAKVFVVPNVGYPQIFTEYSEISWKEETAHLTMVAQGMQNLTDSELLTYFEFDKKTSQIEIRNYLMKVLNYLSVNHKLEKSRITFLISQTDKRRIYYQPVPNEALDVFTRCDDCLVIKGEDFLKLENFFKPKATNKNLRK